MFRVFKYVVTAMPFWILLVVSGQAFAHGWSEFPPARQELCYEQGGIWSGTPPNAACAQAKAISGSYPFVQRNEYSINITDYNDMQVVKGAIPNGTLCYANDPQKKGMGAASSAWTRTDVSAGKFEFVFNATAPHNPSFWQFYLTKPGVDVSQPLKWGDLELIQEMGDVPVENGKYRMDVTIPENRIGDATLFVRWQREDSAGEGFYNCSDITIVNGNTPAPDDPDDETPVGPYLMQGNQFIPQDITLDSVLAGDTVTYKVFGTSGDEHASQQLVITEDNKNDWDRLLAAQINGWYEANHSGDVFLGRWHDEMKHYMYFKNDLYGNYFNGRDAGMKGELSIQVGNQQLEAVISPKVMKELTNATVVNGDLIVLSPSDSFGEASSIQWVQTNGTPVVTSIGPNQELLIDTSQLADVESNLTFKLLVSNGDEQDEAIYSFVVEPSDGGVPVPEEPTNSNWSATQIYEANDVVLHNGKTWTAHWWTQGEEPGATGQWGVWR
ncbi:lytic polysaccharide monooxygenase [Vibrio profundum]|uniref:lytic polysaccharide monooxygenase n=1 Tax=Vibrio profundum TaxID=2910247 RepID=UPI003D0D16D4